MVPLTEQRAQEAKRALQASRPGLAAADWGRLVLEQFLFELRQVGVGAVLEQHFPEPSVDHHLTREQCLQALALFEPPSPLLDRIAFLLAVLDGDVAMARTIADHLNLPPTLWALSEAPR